MSQANSVQDIERVQFSLEDGMYVYEAFTLEPFYGGNPAIVLSKSRNQLDTASYVAQSSDWVGNSGKCRCEIEKLSSVNYLYIFLFDSGKIASPAVRVFTKPPKLLGFQLAGNDLLHLRLDTSSRDHTYAEELKVTNNTTKNAVTLTLPNCSVPLQQLGIWDDTGKTSISLAYSSKSDGAKVICLPIDSVMLSFFGLEITSTAVNGTSLTCTCKNQYPAGTKLLAEILRGDRVIAKIESTLTISHDAGSFEMDLRNLPLDNSELCFMRTRVKDSYGLSLPGNEVPVILATPVLIEKNAIEDGSELVLDKASRYEVYKGETLLKTVQGDRVIIESDKGSVTIRRSEENSRGPALFVDAKCFRYAMFTHRQHNFYMYSYGKAQAPTSDIKVDVDPGLSEYTGKNIFSIKAEGAKRTLEIKHTIIDKLIDSPISVYDEYEDMLKTACKNDPVKVDMLTRAVMDNTPLRAVDSPAFLYRWRVDKGSADLTPGMALCVEYATYQNLPEKNRIEIFDEVTGNVIAMQDDADNAAISDLNGYVSSGMAQYQVIKRNGNVSFEPFVQAFGTKYRIPSPGTLGPEAKVTGGAGIADFLFPGLAAPFLRLIYPTERTTRVSQGEQRFFNNINVAAATTLAGIEEAASALRQQRLPSDKYLNEIAYASMRGRPTLVIKIAVSVCGTVQWVSLGTTVGDIMATLGIQQDRDIKMARASNHGVIPVFGTNLHELLLVSGDCLEVMDYNDRA